MGDPTAVAMAGELTMDPQNPIKEGDLEIYPAIVTIEQVESIVKDLYGQYIHSIQKIAPLIGYDNVNFKITASPPPNNSSDPIDVEVKIMDGMHEMMPKLIQRIFPNKFENKISIVRVNSAKCPAGEGHTHKAMLLQYLPGEPMTNRIPFSSELLKNVGKEFGELSVSLNGKEYPEMKRFWDRKWDPKNVMLAEGVIDCEKDPERRKLLEEFFANFRANVDPFMKSNCRVGICHTDGNPNNILVHESSEKVSAIIDFEDIALTYLVCECASLLMYVFAYCPDSDFNELGFQLMSGFASVQPLSDDEWHVLFDLVCARHVQSLLYGLHASIANPENRDYLLECQASGWKSLKKLLLDSDKKSITTYWRTGKES